MNKINYNGQLNFTSYTRHGVIDQLVNCLTNNINIMYNRYTYGQFSVLK